VKKFGVTVLLWTSGILAVALGFALAIYVHENQPALEAPGAITFFVLGVIFGVLALRTRVLLS